MSKRKEENEQITALEEGIEALDDGNLAAINRSLEDIKAGRVQDAREAMREIAAEQGIHLDR